MPNARFFLDPTIAGKAGPYYTLFPLEPTRSAATSDWLKPDGHPLHLKTQRLDEWLSAIAGSASSGGNIVLVCHGNDSGLRLKIGDLHNDVHLELPASDAIRLNQAGTKSDADAAQMLKMKVDAYGTLRKLIERVQSLALNRVDVRACNLGDNEFAMSAMQQFFNCRTFCAPKNLDSFGLVPVGKPVSDPNTFDRWMKQHPGADITGARGGRFGLQFTNGAHAAAMAESVGAIRAWADAKLPAGGSFNGNNSLYYHAFTDGVTFAFAGEARYRSQLSEARKGKVPSRAIDVNAPLDL